MDTQDQKKVQGFVKDNRELIAMDDVAKSFSAVAKVLRDRVQEIRLADLPVAQKREQIKAIEDKEAELYDHFVKVLKEKTK